MSAKLSISLFSLLILCTLSSLCQSSHVSPQGIKRTWIVDHALPEALIPKMIQDAIDVNKWEASLGDLVNGKRRTRWFPRGDRPKTALEEAIRYLETLAKPGRIKPYRGAEWWVQIVDAGQTGKIGFHLDKDESIASLKHYLVHPEFSSIFYLTDAGGCTLILDQHSPDGNGYTPKEANEGELICPARNRYAVFNGTLLHGVIPGRSEWVSPGTHVDGKRITFLVNWWDEKPELPNCDDMPHKKVPGLRYLSYKKLTQLRQEIGYSPANYTSPYDVHDDGCISEDCHRGQLVKEDLTRSRSDTFVHTYDLPGGRSASAILPRNYEMGGAYTLIWKQTAKKPRGKEDL